MEGGEIMAYIVRAAALGRAHELSVKQVVKHGVELITEDGEKTLELPEPLLIFVMSPEDEYKVSSACMFGEKAMEQYKDDLILGSTKGSAFAYTYHDRLFDYQSRNRVSREVNNSFDQIHNLVHKLNQDPTSRRAQAITWYPEEDLFSDNPPCLQRIQFLWRQERLNMAVEFRSNDILSALGANMYVLHELQRYVAKKLQTRIGWYEHRAISAHIYHERDEYELNKFKEML
jgi:thymidylate synthase